MAIKIKPEVSSSNELSAIEICLSSQLSRIKKVSKKMADLLAAHEVFRNEYEDEDTAEEMEEWDLYFEGAIGEAKRVHTMICLLVRRRSDLQEQEDEDNVAPRKPSRTKTEWDPDCVDY